MLGWCVHSGRSHTWSDQFLPVYIESAGMSTAKHIRYTAAFKLQVVETASMC